MRKSQAGQKSGRVGAKRGERNPPPQQNIALFEAAKC